MRRWLPSAVLIGLITLALAFLLHWRLSTFEAAPDRAVKLLTISAVVDGSDRWRFTTNAVVVEHRQYGWPTDVIFDGQPWTDFKQPPPGWEEIAPSLVLERATLVQRRGRDLIALEHTEDGFDVYWADTPPGGAPYVITVAIPER